MDLRRRTSERQTRGLAVTSNTLGVGGRCEAVAEDRQFSLEPLHLHVLWGARWVWSLHGWGVEFAFEGGAAPFGAVLFSISILLSILYDPQQSLNDGAC